MSKYILPSKVYSYLRRLLLNYEHSGPRELAAIIKHGRVAVDIDKNRSWYNGDDIVGHDVVIFLPPSIIAPISISQQGTVCSRLREDLRECASSISSEYINAVRLELEDENDWLDQTAQTLSAKPPVDPGTLSFWKPDQIRLFVSHRDNYKRQAQALSRALEKFGISCFVAHDTIEPMESWQTEIEKGLETMEVMLALITDDFHKSEWTNQEVGFAKGRNIPVISLKLGVTDPKGFIADKQALKGDVDNPQNSADDIYRLLTEKLGHENRLQTAIIESFLATPDWGEATIRFKLLDSAVKSLSEEEFQRIKTGYEKNDQLYNAAYLYYGSRFLKFLIRTTGKKLRIEKGKILLEQEEEEIPF
jgi:hypothetical protein